MAAEERFARPAWTIVLAAGRGSRLGSRRPKALLDLAGHPLVRHAVHAILASGRFDGVVVVAPPGDQGLVRRSLEDLAPQVEVSVIGGGETRQRSMRLGLDRVPADAAAVVCHDAARPLASPGLFGRVLEGLRAADGAIPALAVTDTVKRVRDGRVIETVPREGFALAQTPQAFRAPALREAHARAAAAGVEGTDDAMLLEAAGYRVAVVPGELSNLKITTIEDLRWAERILAAEPAPVVGPG